MNLRPGISIAPNFQLGARLCRSAASQPFPTVFSLKHPLAEPPANRLKNISTAKQNEILSRNFTKKARNFHNFAFFRLFVSNPSTEPPSHFPPTTKGSNFSSVTVAALYDLCDSRRHKPKTDPQNPPNPAKNPRNPTLPTKSHFQNSNLPASSNSLRRGIKRMPQSGKKTSQNVDSTLILPRSFGHFHKFRISNF